MPRVEYHRSSQSNLRCAALDAAAFASKNLYNVARSTTRQAYIFWGEITTYHRLANERRVHAAYRARPANVSQWVLNPVCAAWDSFFAARAADARDPSRFVRRSKLPQYKEKDGRNLLTYTIQVICVLLLRDGSIMFWGLDVFPF